MSGDDAYIRCHGKITSVRPRTFFIVDEARDIGGWCPRSVIHGADDARLERMEDTTASVRVMAWKAKELGFG